MEKLICTACGAPLTPDTASPFLTCEYCDTAIENKYYVAPAAPVQETIQPTEESAGPQDEGMETEVSGSSIVKTLLGAGTALATNALRNRSRTVAVRRTAARPVLHNGHASTPHRRPEPPRMGSTSARPAHGIRPCGGHPQSRRAGGPRGMGGPGGIRGPGGRHR